MNKFIRQLTLLLMLLLPTFSSVAKVEHVLTGDNVLVLYKKGDTLSKQIAKYYADKRHVPLAQLIAVDLRGSGDKISREKFAEVQQQIQPYLQKKIKVLLLTWNAPYRVECMSMTSALTLGFDEKYCGRTSFINRGCHPTANSDFYNASNDLLWRNDKFRLSMMLSGRDFDEAKQLIDRGVAADFTQPKGDAYLVRTQDQARSVRTPVFERLSTLWPQQKGIQLHYVDDSQRAEGTSVKNKKTVMFYFTGYVQVPDIKTNHYLPGAVADHLTSYGGAGISQSGQMKVYRWLEAGVTGSYGTVVEPCSFPEKFSNPQILIPSYLSGDSLIEAYWKSVQQPGEGSFVGEPLARPWGKR